jgi:DNA-binding NarL/FixJ family response regulator
VIAMTNLVLGDDQGIFLDALSTVLTQRGYQIGAVARSSAEMIAFVRSQRPDACLIDCSTAPDGGVEAIGRVIAASDDTSVLVLGADPCRDAARRAIDAGASAYLHQSRGVDALISALGQVARGELVVDIPDDTPRRQPRANSHAERAAAALTSRERECLEMLVEGLDTDAMVARLGVARTTVRTHLQSVLTKLGVHSRLEAASFAVRHRLLEPRAESTPSFRPQLPAPRERPDVRQHAAARPVGSRQRLHLAAVEDREAHAG